MGWGWGLGPIQKSPKAWWRKGQGSAGERSEAQNRGRGRGGALATSEVRRDPGARPVLCRARDARHTMAAAALAKVWAPPGPPEGV